MAREAYDLLTANFPVGERFGLVSQMDRAAAEVVGTLQEVIRLLPGLVAALERRIEK